MQDHSSKKTGDSKESQQPFPGKRKGKNKRGKKSKGAQGGSNNQGGKQELFDTLQKRTSIQYALG